MTGGDKAVLDRRSVDICLDLDPNDTQSTLIVSSTNLISNSTRHYWHVGSSSCGLACIKRPPESASAAPFSPVVGGVVGRRCGLHPCSLPASARRAPDSFAQQVGKMGIIFRTAMPGELVTLLPRSHVFRRRAQRAHTPLRLCGHCSIYFGY